MKHIVILLFSILIIGCSDEATSEDVFSNLTLNPTVTIADGNSVVEASVELTSESSTDRRNVVFTTTSGKFVSTDSNKATVKAEYESGVLIARAKFKVTTEPGEIKVKVQPEFDSPLREFFMEKSIVAEASVPATITLSVSSFGLAGNHLGEVKITGKLKNAVGRSVSAGYKVVFKNYLMPLEIENAGGLFRDLHTTTTDASEVSAYFSAFDLPVGTNIKILAILVDNNGVALGPTDSVIVTVNL